MIRELIRRGVTQTLFVLRISDAALSAITITLTGLTLATCLFYSSVLLVGGFGGRVKQTVLFIFAALITTPLVKIIFKATSEEGLEELKRNRAFEFMLLLATLARDSLAAIVLFRLALYAGLLFSQKGVDEGASPLWQILRQVVFG